MMPKVMSVSHAQSKAAAQQCWQTQLTHKLFSCAVVLCCLLMPCCCHIAASESTCGWSTCCIWSQAVSAVPTFCVAGCSSSDVFLRWRSRISMKHNWSSRHLVLRQKPCAWSKYGSTHAACTFLSSHGNIAKPHSICMLSLSHQRYEASVWLACIAAGQHSRLSRPFRHGHPGHWPSQELQAHGASPCQLCLWMHLQPNCL